MKTPWNYFRGRGNSAPKIPAHRRPILEVEILEDRVVLTTLGPSNNPSANDWRDLTFQINNQTPVSISGTVTSQSMEDSSLIGLPQVMANYSYRGTGYTVAVIDTGIDYNNPYLGGGWGNRVIGGWNFVANNSNPMDDNGHGTGVAGIIGSSDPSDLGIAPNVDFVALKVLDSTGSGSFGNVDLALQWVAAHQAQYNIVAVNMSLGSGNYTSDPFTFLESDFETLTSQNIFISVAAGNSYYTYGSAPGLAYPAVSPNVVSVGATWDGNYGAVTWANGSQDYTTAPGLITSFTQRDSSLDILAPGAMITTETLNNQFATEAGTSMSTPVITGAAVLLHQALDALGDHGLTSQQDLLTLMQNTGTSVVDNNPSHDNVVNTGLTFKMLNLYAALSSLKAATPPPATPTPTAPPVLGSLANQTMASGQTLTVNLTATDPAGLSLQYSAQAVGLASQAYQLQQQFGLAYMGSYFYDAWGQNEKWLLGTGSVWYCLTSDGDLRKWSGTMAATMQPSGVIASLGAAYYSNPSLLWNAPAASTPPVTVTVNGSTLTIAAPTSYTGNFQVNVTVSDGHNSATGNFQVTVNAAPSISFPSTASLSSSAGSGTITLPGTDSSGHALSYAASLGGSLAQAGQLETSLGLRYLGSYFQNLFGQNEKWLGGSGGTLYFLLPNGNLYKFTGSMTPSAANLIANVGSADYTNPQLLLSPVQPTFQVSGNQLTVHYPQGYAGSFVVNVTVTDGGVVSTQTITVTVSSTPTGSSSAGKAADVAEAPAPAATGSASGGTGVSVNTDNGTDGGVNVAGAVEIATVATPSFAQRTDVEQSPASTTALANWPSDSAPAPCSADPADTNLAMGSEYASSAVGEWLADNPV